MKKIISVIVSVTLLLMLLPTYAFAQDPVNYIDENGTLQTITVYDTVYSGSAASPWANGWYVVKEDVEVTSRITVQGTVNLLICDGTYFHAKRGFEVTEGNTLNIFGQGLSSGVLATDKASSGAAAIGSTSSSGSVVNCGVITINGGTVVAQGGDWAAAIGGGSRANGGTIIINGGNVTATGSNSGGTGIGGGQYGAAGNITILKGTVIASNNGGSGAAIGNGENGNGGSITISGGNITANAVGGFGAGIGSGSSGSCPAVNISGGTVNVNTTVAGAGIGTGRTGQGGSVTIGGGDITVVSADCGIGAGGGGYLDTITINGGTINAKAGGSCAGIGNYSNTSVITINGGDITSTGGQYGAGIGGASNWSGGTININGGFVNATGGQSAAAIGAGYASDAGLINLCGGQITAVSGQSGFGIGAAYSKTGGEIHFNLSNASDFVLSDNYHVNTIIFDHTHYIYGTATVADTTNITNNKVVKDSTVQSIKYIDGNGDEQVCSGYTSLVPTTEPQTWNSGWYAVTENIAFDGRVTVNGTVHLILGDGATFNAKKGITVNEGNTFVVYAQSGKSGALVVDACENYCAAIGASGASNMGNNCGTVIINGGVITASAAKQYNQYGAGIGGSLDGNGGTITINAGTVTAFGADGGTGIGGGFSGTSGLVTINGGTVNATGGSNAAGIGGGAYDDADTIIINGGTVNATGGSGGAGIGGGLNHGYTVISITGGNITANGGAYSNSTAPGIGSGYKSSGSVVINYGALILDWKTSSDRIITNSVSAENIAFAKHFYIKESYTPALIANTIGGTLIPYTPGDMNSDGAVDISDIGEIISFACNGNGDLLKNVIGDYNFDGTTDGFDAAKLDREV